jgi:hypothetical protein
MALKLYRRRRKECEGGHPEDAKSGEFEEGRRDWKRCACLIHASGTFCGEFNCKQTGKLDWEEAKARRRSLGSNELGGQDSSASGPCA